MRLVGVDPAWKPETNGSAIAVGRLNGATLDVEQIHGAVFGLACVAATILAAEPDGVAIDGPLTHREPDGSAGVRESVVEGVCGEARRLPCLQ